MVEIICTAITALATVICGYMAITGKQRSDKEEKRAEQRVKEGRLQLAMIAANNELSIGTAMAVKNGHANGEMEKGLEAVKKAQADYLQFLENIAIEDLHK